VDSSWIDPVVWVVLGVVSLAALVTGVGLVIKALSLQSHYLVSSLIGIFALAVLTAIGLLAPLAFLSGKQYQQSHLFADLLMMGISGLVILGVTFFIVDHLQERPGFLMLAAAASLAIGIFPWIYILNIERFNKQFDISITSPEKVSTAGLNPLEGQRASLSESSQLSKSKEDASSESNDKSENNVDLASRFGPLTPPPKPLPVQSSEAVPTESSAEAKVGGKDWLYDDP